MATVDTQLTGGVARLTLNNPKRYNAMTLSMWQALGDTLEALAARGDVRAVLLRGHGDKAFVSGADISEFETARNDPANIRAYNTAVARAQNLLSSFPAPVVACIHGVCMGGGIGLALACDLRYCATDAKIRMPAARLGLGYDYDGMRQIVHTIGAATAAALFYTARTINGIEAMRIGLVQQAFAADQLDAEVNTIVQEIEGNAPLTLRAAKLAIRHAVSDERTSPPAVSAAIQACFDSQDYQEGRQAFMEKRPPRFIGR